MPSHSRRLFAFNFVLLVGLGFQTTSNGASFPALNAPASLERHPGKFVWADLFTANPASATKFYCSLFGWTATTLDQKGKTYTVFSNDGQPVAGLAPRSIRGGSHPSRWIGYLAVTDIVAAVQDVIAAGGKVRAKPHDFPDRGAQAICADKDDNPFGLLQSSSGDSVDDEPKPGEWNWFELYAKTPSDSAEFYHKAVGIEVTPETKSDRKSDFVLSSNGQARGGIAPLPTGSDVRPSWLGVVRVADLDRTLAKVSALGGEVLVAPHEVEFGSRFAIILDSTGGTLGLVQYADNANPANRP